MERGCDAHQYMKEHLNQAQHLQKAEGAQEVRAGFPEEGTFGACSSLETLEAVMTCKNVTMIEL